MPQHPENDFVRRNLCQKFIEYVKHFINDSQNINNEENHALNHFKEKEKEQCRE